MFSIMAGEIMPPRPKFTKEDMIKAAFDITCELGIGAVTARQVGEKLGTSVSPIFACFSGMDELRAEVLKMAWSSFCGYLEESDICSPSFKARILQTIRFAQDEPRLFQALFMAEQKAADFAEQMKMNSAISEADIESIQSEYGISESDANRLLRHIRAEAFGICALCAVSACSFSASELESFVSEAFEDAALAAAHRTGNAVPVRAENGGLK